MRLTAHFTIYLHVSRISYIIPATPILVKQPPVGPNWLHEIKWDGWRCQIIKDVDGIRIYSRKQNEWTDELPTIVAAVHALELRTFVIDGELVAATAGHDFYTIPEAVRRQQVHVIAFDLLHLNGKDLRRFTLEKRKAALEKLFVSTDSVIQLSETFNDPFSLLKAAEEYGLEGIVSKRKDLPYRSGRCPHWQKVKTAAWREAHKDRGERLKRKKRS